MTGENGNPPVLELRVRSFADRTRWRWTLTGRGECFLADHEVNLDPSDRYYKAFTDLRHHISWNADPGDRRAEAEARIVADARAWAAEHVFGNVANVLGRREYKKAIVRVVLPPGAEDLAFLPLELAVPPNVVLVIQAGSANTTSAPVGEKLRVLGLFSLPEGHSPLNLRRERHEFVKLIRGIAANNRTAEVKVLQYGVTRQRLQEILEDAAGWDIIHISGHGSPGELLLETQDGRPYRITADELADLLELAAGRVKLVTVAACWSAARTANEQRRLLMLPVHDDQRQIAAERVVGVPPQQPPGALATELTDRLSCAVLAMRYPIADDFAIKFSGKLYDLIIDKGQPLPRAVAMTLDQLRKGEYPALSLAAPAIFGATAVGLTLRAPERDERPRLENRNLKLAGFPPQPDRFVGRTGVMARASAALAAGSEKPGILLYGMPGGGKTACAIELAYGHEDAFPGLVWYRAPDEGAEISGSLTDLALAMERCVDGLRMADKVATGNLSEFLPVLTELMERTRLLIVVDNAESLLTSTGDWRDDRWGQTFGALTNHRGLGRIVFTSRRVPGDTCGLRVESVDALTADEALLLARELPHLQKLINGEVPGLDRETSRRLALGVLNVAKGHPKLLELANGQAEHPDQLTALIRNGRDTRWEQGGLPDGFFGVGATVADPDDYRGVLESWTRTVTDTLTSAQRDVFWLLCCLEENDLEHFPDRLHMMWPALWEQLDRSGEPPNLDQALAALAARGLAAIRTGTDGEPASYGIHPGVAEVGRDCAGPDFQVTINFGIGVYWMTTFSEASGLRENVVDTQMLVRAGLAGTPYLVRTAQWRIAGELLEKALEQDPSRTNAAKFMLHARLIADHDPRWQGALALCLQEFDLFAAERQLYDSLDEAVARSDYQIAWRAAGRLADLCRESGRLNEALSLIGRMADYIQQAELGSWGQLFSEAKRLRVLIDMGQARMALARAQGLSDYMDTLPARVGLVDLPSWEVQETVLETGRVAASHLGYWGDALDYDSKIVESLHARNATNNIVFRARYNDYKPLLQLGRADDVLVLLQECRQFFQGTGDTKMLSKILAALAETERQRGYGNAASEFERDAQRYTNLVADPFVIAESYYTLASEAEDANPAAALAGYLMAALIVKFTLGTVESPPAREASSMLVLCRERGIDVHLPSSRADLYRRLDGINPPDTDPSELITRLCPVVGEAEEAFRAIIERVKNWAIGDI